MFQYSPSRDGPIASSWNVTYADDSDVAWAPDAFIGSGVSRLKLPKCGNSLTNNV